MQPARTSSNASGVLAPRPAPSLRTTRAAVVAATRHLIAMFGPGGRIRAGCRGRPLETALTLHLLRQVNRHPGARRRLERFCAHHLDSPGGREDLDGVVNRLAARAVLGRRGPDGQDLRCLLRQFEHPARARKAALFQALLAELAGTRDWAAGLGDAPAPGAKEHHLWARLKLLALRLLGGQRTGGAPIIAAGDVDALLAHQSPNGTWERHLLLTVLALLALARIEGASRAFDRGLAALLASMQDDGGVPFITDEDTWITALAGHVALEVGAPSWAVAPAASYIALQQNPDGGWPYAEQVVLSDGDTTSIATSFLARCGAAFAGYVARGANNLVRLGAGRGGVPTFVTGAEPDVEITAKAMRALAATGQLTERQAERSISWIAARQAPDGGFRTEWKLCPTYPLLHVCQALEQLGGGSVTARRVRGRSVAYLRATQLPDGSWGMTPAHAEGHELSTAYAVGALAAAGRRGRRSLARGVRFLLSRQQEDGSWRCTGDSLGPRPLIYDVAPLATIYCLWGLGRAYRALEGS